MNNILAIDPGSTESGIVLVEHDGHEIKNILMHEKLENDAVVELLRKGFCEDNDSVVCSWDMCFIERIESYGMAVGAEVFETCIWTGRFVEALYVNAPQNYIWKPVYYIPRRDEKLDLCGNVRAKDSNITAALVERFAPGEANFGKGTKKAPGFFYGFFKDVWAAMAVATTGFDGYVTKEYGLKKEWPAF